MRHYFAHPAEPNYTLIEIVPESVTVKGAWELDYHDVPLTSTTQQPQSSGLA